MRRIGQRAGRPGPPVLSGVARAWHDNQVAGGNLVGFRWSMTEVRASGDESMIHGLDLVRIENGKIAEPWIEYHNPQRPE